MQSLSKQHINVINWKKCFACTKPELLVMKQMDTIVSALCMLYLGQVEEDLDGEGNDLHAGSAPVAAAYQREDDIGGSAFHQPPTALWRQPSGSFCTESLHIKHILWRKHLTAKRREIGFVLQSQFYHHSSIRIIHNKLTPICLTEIFQSF